MILLTTDTLPGHRIVEVMGLVRGNSVRTRHLGYDIMARLKNVVGGEVVEYTKMMAEAREQALDRMKMHAKRLQADGIVCVRFTTSPIMAGAAELLAYGTAVKLAPRGSQPPPMKPAEPVKVPAASGESGNFMLERG